MAAESADSELAVYDFKTRKKALLGATGSKPSWSPDGRWLAYVWRGAELRLYDPESGRVQALSTGLERDLDATDDFQLAIRPSWSADSRLLHFELGYQRDPKDGSQVFAQNFVADLERREVWRADDYVLSLAWSPVLP